MHLPFFFSIKILPSPWCKNKSVESLDLKLHSSGKDGQRTTSFLLLRGGPELSSVAEGPLLRGGAVAAHQQQRETSSPGADPRHHLRGRRVGLVGEHAGEGSREGSLEPHGPCVALSASSAYSAMRQLTSFSFSRSLARRFGMVFEGHLHVTCKLMYKVLSSINSATALFFP